jgi:tRNA threonylcarbamoyladenosine biosynthesis protein TsaE
VGAHVLTVEAVGADLARSLAPGDVVALEGDLGAGKTQFVRGLLRGLGGDPRLVSSPTYVLLNVYPGGRLTLFHLDAYRTAGADDLAGIGFDELLDQGGVVAVEWPSRVGELLPARRYTVTLTAIGEGRRVITVMPPGNSQVPRTGVGP